MQAGIRGFRKFEKATGDKRTDQMNKNMPHTLDEFRCKLMNKILFAASQDEVIRYCQAALKGLEQHQVNPFIISRFVEKVISDLEQYNPLTKEAQQWSNIQTARIQFIRIRHRFSTIDG